MVILAFVSVLAAVAGSIVAVPTDSWVYDDLELLKTSGFVQTMPSTSRPWTRAEAAVLVAEADSTSLYRRLGPGQRAALGRLKYEFAAELGQESRRRPPTVTLRVPGTDGRAVRADFFSRAKARWARQSLSVGVVCDNRPAESFCFYERIEMTAHHPDTMRVFDDPCGVHLPGYRLNAWRDFVTFEMEHAYLGFRLPWFRLQAGRNDFFWGPGFRSSVMLSDNAPSLDNLQLCASYPNFKFLAFTSYLSRWFERHRFLSGQRMELSLWNRVTLGGAMLCVHSWDSLQTTDFAGMLNPLLPIYFSVANSDHNDNLLVGWDAAIYLPYCKLYGQLFLDNYEFNTAARAPNAVGLQAGAHVVPQLPVEARLEYARVNAFTYYHVVDHIMYENWCVPLGHEIGPDADQLYAALNLVLSDALTTGLQADYVRRGFYNRGGYERRAFNSGVKLPIPFPAVGKDASGNPLAPDWEVERTLRIGPGVTWWPLVDLVVTGTAGYRASWNHEGMPGSFDRGFEADIRVAFKY